MMLGVAFFFWLHHVANQLPYGLAQQRFAAEFQAPFGDLGVARGFKSEFEYCQVSAAVLADADPTLARTFPSVVLSLALHLDDSGYCGALREASRGEQVQTVNLKVRYWWGNKAIYAIALRYISVAALRELTKAITYIAFGLLAAALLLHSARMALTFAPVLLLGAYHSGVEYFADVLNGMPFAWTILAAAALAWLLRPVPAPRSGGRGARPFCFVAGMMSSYLWMGDGHQPLAIALIGLIAYFADERDGVRRAAWCIGLYLAGFAICYALGLLVKSVVIGLSGPLPFLAGAWEVFESFWVTIVLVFERTATEGQGGVEALLRRHHRLYAELAWGRKGHPVGFALSGLALAALIAASCIAVREALRRRWEVPRAVGFVMAMMALNAPNFFVLEDIPYRTARFFFLLHGLSFFSLIVALRTMQNGRHAALVAGGMVGIYAAALAYASIRERQLLDWLDSTAPAFESEFNVYQAGNRLYYTRDHCAREQLSRRFFLHVWPAAGEGVALRSEAAAGGGGATELEFDLLDRMLMGWRDGRRCVAVLPLPNRALAGYRTGQFDADGVIWQVEYRSGKPGHPDGPSAFEVYFDGCQVRYVGKPCDAVKVRARFFVHAYRVGSRGFDNLDFSLLEGSYAQERCSATVALPDGDFAMIQTGQFTSGVGAHWLINLVPAATTANCPAGATKEFGVRPGGASSE